MGMEMGGVMKLLGSLLEGNRALFYGVLPGVLEVTHLVASQVSTSSGKLDDDPSREAVKSPLQAGCLTLAWSLGH